MSGLVTSVLPNQHHGLSTMKPTGRKRGKKNRLGLMYSFSCCYCYHKFFEYSDPFWLQPFPSKHPPLRSDSNAVTTKAVSLGSQFGIMLPSPKNCFKTCWHILHLNHLDTIWHHQEMCHDAFILFHSVSTCSAGNFKVFSSGCYTFADFPRVGFGIVIIVGIVSVAGSIMDSNIIKQQFTVCQWAECWGLQWLEGNMKSLFMKSIKWHWDVGSWLMSINDTSPKRPSLVRRLGSWTNFWLWAKPEHTAAMCLSGFWTFCACWSACWIKESPWLTWPGDDLKFSKDEFCPFGAFKCPSL